MANQLNQEQTDRIAEALAAGRKIEAIKIHREATGMGLKESKDFVDALIPQLQQQDPVKYAALSNGRGTGCASMILAGIGLLTATVVWALRAVA